MRGLDLSPAPNGVTPFIPQDPVSLPAQSEVLVITDAIDRAAQERLDQSIRAYYLSGDDADECAPTRRPDCKLQNGGRGNFQKIRQRFPINFPFFPANRDPPAGTEEPPRREQNARAASDSRADCRARNAEFRENPVI